MYRLQNPTWEKPRRRYRLSTLHAVDTVAIQINEAIRRWGNGVPRPLPPKDQLAAEWDWVVGLLATNPPGNQAGALTTTRDRIGQARRALIPQAATGF